MDTGAQGIRLGEAAATGATAITVEKHKSNFKAQHGTFADKPSQNITRWLQKAQDYKDAHMIQSLEMGSILIHCITGEPAVKIRRLLEVPGDHYKHADHFCQQNLQTSILYTPYIPRQEKEDEIKEVSTTDPNGVKTITVHAKAAVPMKEATPSIMPMRYQPEVTKEHCLKHYLIKIYQKRVNLSEADKFLTTFKTQRPKQTCSNYLDEFILNYENYAHLKWSQDQLNGTDRSDGPPIVEKTEGNFPLRNAEILRLVTDGICKEFKIHCDNTKFNLDNTDFETLEDTVNEWQRSTTTGKAFTSTCTQAKPTVAATAAATEFDEYFDQAMDLDPSEENFTSAILPAPPSIRGQRGARGVRGGPRGGRGRGIRGRGANTNGSQIPFISRDVEDGNHPNYRQTIDNQLQRSSNGFPLCNYCGGPSHKRQHCPVKAHDREAGNKRLHHPDRDKGTSVQDKTKRPMIPLKAATSAIMQQPMTYNLPYQQMWQQPSQQQATAMTAPASAFYNNAQWGQPSASDQNIRDFNYNIAATQMTPMTQQQASPCPYPTCQAILADQNQKQDHMRMFHSIQTLAQAPGAHP